MATTEGNPQTYKLGSQDSDINQHFEDAIDVIQQHSANRVCYEYDTADYRYYETLGVQQQPALCQISCCLLTHPADGAASHDPIYECEWTDATQSWPQGLPDVSLGHPATSESPQFYPILPPNRNGKGRKKLRLYEYLHEALNDPNMGDSIQWADSVSGTFHFISKNKEKLAECWGQRKGNRKTMTYQKMARALRNYSRTGEIVKVRRKLTYRFNPAILQRLGGSVVPMPSSRHPAQQEAVVGHHSLQTHHVPPEPGYYSSDWHHHHGWYGVGHYSILQDDSSYDLAASLTSHNAAKL